MATSMSSTEESVPSTTLSTTESPTKVTSMSNTEQSISHTNLLTTDILGTSKMTSKKQTAAISSMPNIKQSTATTGLLTTEQSTVITNISTTEACVTTQASTPRQNLTVKLAKDNTKAQTIVTSNPSQMSFSDTITSEQLSTLSNIDGDTSHLVATTAPERNLELSLPIFGSHTGRPTKPIFSKS